MTGIPASLRTSRVGRVTKPAPSISTLLEAASHVSVWKVTWCGIFEMLGCIYCWEAMLGVLCDFGNLEKIFQKVLLSPAQYKAVTSFISS